MNKATKVTYEGGMNQDITKSKHPPNFYFEGRNIRIVATDSQSTGSVTNEKGNSFILTIPTITINSNVRQIQYTVFETIKSLTYSIIESNIAKSIRPRNELEVQFGITNNNPIVISGEQVIIGTGRIRNYFILFTTDNNGFDCIWKLEEKSFDLELLYLRNLGFSTQNPIQVIGNFENEKTDKIYWIDEKHQLRFLNTLHSIENGDNENLIDLPLTLVNQVSNVNLNQPQIVDKVFGGNHTSGMIQYAYNLYNIGGSQTTISPISELVSLDKGSNNGGGDVNEIVGSIPVVKILNIDPNYNNIQIYAIKYTSFNQIPSISLIVDSEVPQNKEFTHYDDGNIIQTISLEEFVFLGSSTIIPKNIESKDNRLFLANYKEENFDIDLDCRAYSFNSSGTASVADSFTTSSNNLMPFLQINLNTPNPQYTSIPEKHSAINIDYNNYKFDTSGNLGGEGQYIKYNIIRTQLNTSKQHFKDEELYRIGIEFYNKKGQYSPPKWIADFKSWIENNENNLRGFYSGLKVTLKTEFYTWLNNDDNFLDENGVFNEDLKPVGYKIVRANRELKDRSILFQGILNPTMSMSISNSNNGDWGYGDLGTLPPGNMEEADLGLKMPSMMRRFDDYLCPMRGANGYAKLNPRNNYVHPQVIMYPPPLNNDTNRSREIRKAAQSSAWVANFYQYNQLMQLFSPEILFNDISQITASRLKVIGSLNNSDNSFWGQERRIDTQEVDVEGKVFGAISPHDLKTGTTGSKVEIEGDIDHLVDHGYIAGTADNTSSDKLMVFNQIYREYLGAFTPRSNGPIYYDFYGSPTIVEKGQGRTTYNNDSNFNFSNSWEGILTDGGDARPLKSVNSWGARSVLFALGDTQVSPNLRTRIEQINQNGINTNSSLIGELSIPENLLYVGGLYGGNSYEAKKRTNYIGIGDYKKISTVENIIISPGDTFIGNFKFLKLSKTDTEIYSNTVAQFTEIVQFKVETSVDLKNRNDQSLFDWDNRFQPREDEYHKYNRVYSQQPSLLIKRDFEYNFKRVNNFDTNVITTSLKSPGEKIDNWTKLLQNEVLTLDGKYGAINSLVNFRDQIFTLQDNSLAFLSINPRVQVDTSDGIGLELGFGSVLQEYKYISTESGTKDKWSVLSTPNAFYYFDRYNKALKMFREGDVKLSTIKGLKTYFNNNTTFGGRIVTGSVNKNISTGYDYLNDEAIFTFIANNKPFTLIFNENLGVFTSFYDYKPSFWISRGDNLLATTVNNKSIYKQFDGEYNNFFGQYYPSYITLMINPEADLDCVFDNIMYKSELYLNDIDQPDKTLTHIQAFNEYQDSGLIPLELGRNKNLRRKFRNWHALIPREGRNRIRNPWIYLKLQLTNEDNYKMILHDVNIFYTT